MVKGQEKRTGWRQYGKYCAACCGSVLLCAFLCSCMSVKYDMRKLEQPVTMNGNPFVGDRSARPSMKPVDDFSATVSSGVISSSYGGYTSTESTSVNEAQVKAFEKIGGDNSMTITDVKLSTESLGIDLLLSMGSDVSITATGKVRQVNLPAKVKKENAQ
ncbi:MAG: hypothetical protein NTX01_03615 [Candidatus Omnitrophica bacterium]|nr:hypothetical protein [Candidatus Omnitrophota bacterium]